MAASGMMRIPFNRPYTTGREADYVAQAIRNQHLSGDGPFTKKCSALLEQFLGAPRVLLTTSCTHALEMAALLLDIQPGDEVIVPSFTFVSTINAFVLRGCKPVFADVRPDTLNLDEGQLRALITKRTKAIVIVHYAGVACAMDEIFAIAAEHGIPVIEDNAHGLFGTYRSRPLGTFGALACQSFHETKNIHSGEGGALVINDQRLIERAEVIREKGTDRSKFFRGQVDKYTWVDVGSSFLPSELNAAFLYAQLQAYPQTQERRRTLWNGYRTALADWAVDNGVYLPTAPPECSHPYHMFYMLLPTAAARGTLIEHLKSVGICAVFHYLPLHLSPMGRRFGSTNGQCPVSEDLSERLLRLPFYTGMTEEEQRDVIDRILKFECGPVRVLAQSVSK